MYKENSTSEKFFDLVVRLRKIELNYSYKISVTHVSGGEMIDQGICVVSRCNLKECVSVGEEMPKLCHWSSSTLEYNSNLKS